MHVPSATFGAMIAQVKDAKSKKGGYGLNYDEQAKLAAEEFAKKRTQRLLQVMVSDSPSEWPTTRHMFACKYSMTQATLRLLFANICYLAVSDSNLNFSCR